MRRRSLVAAALLAIVVMTAAIPVSAVDPATLAAEAPDVVTTGEIAAKAAELGNDPVKIYEFVRNEFAFEIYYGLMKGPVATLRSRAGNDYDLAALLVSLLRSANIPARFVRGRVTIPSAKVGPWTGANDAAGARQLFLQTQPPGWATPQTLGLGVGVSGGNLELVHVWVEAYAPLGSYRGSGGNSDLANRGQAWVALDPSFKLRDWNPDPALPIGQGDLAFDYDDYYADVQSKLPIEIFEDQLRKYWATQHPGGSPQSFEDAVLTGRIRKEIAGVLPTSLPYAISAAIPVGRHPSLVPLHQFGSGGLSPAAAAGAAGPLDYRYQRKIFICRNGVEECDNPATSSADRLLEASGWSAAWNGKRLTIWFPPTAASQAQLRPVGYAASSCTGVGGVDIFTIPTVSADGATQVESTTQIKLCTPLEVVVLVHDPLDCDHGLIGPKGFNIKAGEVNVASFDEGGVSDADVAEEGAALAALLNAYPLAQDPTEDLAFIDWDRNGAKDANEVFLPAVPVLDELLTGQLLHLAHTWYWNHMRKAERRVAELHQLRTSAFPGYGRVTSGREVEYLEDLPFGIEPSNLLIDIGSASGFYTRGGAPSTDHAFRLMLNHGSALEHAVWEEIAGVGAVSTVQGFQLGLDLSENDPDAEIGLLKMTSFDEAKSQVQGRCNASGCNKAFEGSRGLDLTTFCAIRQSFPSKPGETLPDPPGWGSACDAAFNGATTELRVLNKSNFDYDGWRGFVYTRFAQSGGTTSATMAIGPTGANGGYATMRPMDPWDHAVNDILSEVYPFHADFTNPVSASSTLVTANDPVSVTHGSYYETHTDLVIPGPGGMNLQFTRSYNSRLERQGHLGFGWVHTFEQRLREDDGEPASGDEKVIWLTEGATEVPWDRAANGTLTPSAGNHDQLVKNANGTYTLTTHGGLVYSFLAPINKIARLDRIADRNGNTITVHWQSSTSDYLDYVIDAAGRRLEFDHEFQYFPPFPFTIRDWTGREWHYETTSSLVSYTDPEGHVWEYEYYEDQSNAKLDHNMKRYRKPAVRGGEQYEMLFEYYPNDTVYRHTDSLGRESRFSYNFFRKRTDVFNADGGVESYFYDADANVTRYQSAEGFVTEYEFAEPETHERTREVDPMGYATLLEYDADGNPKKRTNRNGDFETWTYNAFARPLVHTDALGNETQLVYDATGVNVIEERADLNGANLRLLKTHGYDARGNRKSTKEWFTNLRSVTTNFDYDPVTFHLVKISAPLATETRIVPDPLGRPLRIERDRTVGPIGAQTKETAVVTREYDGLDRVVRETDAGGLVREVDYDANGLVTEMRSIVQYAQSEPVVRIDQQNVYDAMDRRTSTTNVLGHATTFTYDDRDRLTHVTTPMGKVVETVYDLDGRPVAAVDPVGATTRTTYDPVGRPIRITDALDRIFETTYDPEGRVLSRRDAGRTVFQLPVYDAVGNLKEWRDANVDVKAQQTFDELGRRESLSTGVGTSDLAVVLFDYDYPGRLIKKTDPNNHVTDVTYDDLGRVQVVTDALSRPRATYAYDELSNVVQVTDGAGKVVRREYDLRGLLVAEHDEFTGKSSAFRYDRRGRLVWTKSPALPTDTIETFAYDDLDRRIERTDALGGVERFAYDPDGQLRQHVQLPGGGTVEMVLNYDYDARGLLTEIRDPEAGLFQFDADELGRPVLRTGPGGSEWRAAYTPEGDVKRIDIIGGGPPQFFLYDGFDARGYPTTIQTLEGTTTLEYTPVGRLKAATHPNSTFERYSYDAAGNRKLKINLGDPTQGRYYNYDAADQLTEIRQGSIATGPILETFGHDGAGRRASQTAGGVTTSYGYDGLGRLTSVTRSGYSATLEYGASGRRTKRVETGSTNATSTYPTPRLEQRGSAVFRLLRAGAVGQVIAEIETRPEGARSRTLYRDASQNVGHVARKDAGASTPSNETVRRWTAFGSLRVGSPTNPPVERGYASQQQEGASGLVYMGARHYDPATGRFLQPDPLGVAASELYAYAANSPYMFWDPSGLMPFSLSGGGLLDQRLGFGGGLAVAGVGAAGAVGAGYGVAAVLGATGCAASIVCGGAVALAAVGAVGYDAYNGGLSRIGESFSSVWSGDTTVGQSLEAGAVASGIGSLTAIGTRSAISIASRPAIAAGTDLVQATELARRLEGSTTCSAS
jgi:RHS repeat-associated protein